MKIQNVDVTFSHSADVETRTFMVSECVFGVEIIGEVLELVDYTLEENDEGVRQTIEMKMTLDLFKTIFIAQFLAATDKKITIDGTVFEVVNGSRRMSFPMFKKSNIRTNPKLSFRVKTPGIQTPTIAIPIEGAVT